MKSVRSSCQHGAGCLAGWPVRRGALAAAAAAVLAGASLAAVPQARADGGLDSHFFMVSETPANTLSIAQDGAALLVGAPPMAAHTRPAIAWGGPANSEAQNDYVVAYVSNTGMLSTAGFYGALSLNKPVMPGTAPAVTALPGGNTGYEIAYQGPNGHLFTYLSSSGTAQDTGLAMSANSSPSITVDSSGIPLIAYDSSSNNLATYGEINDTAISAMKAHTTPSVATQQNGSYVIASQGNDGNLFITQANTGSVDTGLGMDPHASPTVSGVLGPPNGAGYAAVFEANTDVLWTTGAYGTKSLQQTLVAGAAPSIAGLERPNVCSNNTKDKIPVSGMDISWVTPSGALVEMTLSITPTQTASWSGGVVKNDTGGQSVELGSASSETGVGLDTPLSLPCNVSSSGTVEQPIVIPDLPDFGD
jgi:hypothetical protein